MTALFNHRGVVQHQSELQYRQRSYILGDLDDATFKALNDGEGVNYLNGYCLDALEMLPCGSMKCGYPLPYENRRGAWAGHQSAIPRGLSLAEFQEQQDMISRLVSELIEEEP